MNSVFHAHAGGLCFVRLATPTTDDRRLPAVLANTSGFLYYVSITGVTGAAAPDFHSGGRGGGANQAPHPVAGRGRLRGPRRESAAAIAAACRRRGGRLRPVGAVRTSLDRGRATPSTVPAVTALVASPRRACIASQSKRRQASRQDSGTNRAMNWISNVVPPKSARYCAAKRPESVGQMPGQRPARFSQGPRGQFHGGSRIGLSHADRGESAPRLAFRRRPL